MPPGLRSRGPAATFGATRPRTRDGPDQPGTRTVRARGPAARAVARGDPAGAGRRRLERGPDPRRAGRLRRGGLPGAGAETARLAVGARGVPVPGAVRDPVFQRLP